MDDEREMMYLALSNSIMYYNTLLDADFGLSPDDIKLSTYIRDRQLEILDKLYPEMLDKPISRPRWGKE